MGLCVEKERYTKKEAKEVARRVGLQKKKYMRFYKCHNCGKYHVTSQKKRVRK